MLTNTRSEKNEERTVEFVCTAYTGDPAGIIGSGSPHLLQL